jgi:hypothetical protein
VRCQHELGFTSIGSDERGKCGGTGIEARKIGRGVMEERVQGELGEASLGFVAQNGVTLSLNGQRCIA